MFCTNCGKPFKGDEKFCTNCGAPRATAPAAGTPPAPAQQSAPATPPPAAPKAPPSVPQPAPAAQKPAPAPKKKSSAGLVIAIIALVVVLVAALSAGAWWLLSDRDGADSSKPAQVSDDERKDRKEKGEEEAAAPATAEPTAQPTAAPTDEPAGYDYSAMLGTYYCPDVKGRYLLVEDLSGELRVEMGQLDYDLDYFQIIPAPEGPNFSVEFTSDPSNFFFSEAEGSFTVITLGQSEYFTLDGDLNWSNLDPFSDPDGFILPSDTRYLTAEDLAPYDAEQLKYIRNEIYARHGYTFTMDKFRDYFLTKNWYREDPAVNANTFGTAQMNEYELTNLDLIRAREAELG